MTIRDFLVHDICCTLCTATLTKVLSAHQATSYSTIKGKKVKVSHSLIAVGAVGVESPCILGTADERWSPSLSFRCLNLP